MYILLNLKQTWICAKCKKKQEVLLKSGQWLNSPVLNKKNFSSDYILNKTQSGGARPANHLMYSSNTNAPRTTATSSSSSSQVVENGRQAAASKRMLPNLTQLTKQSSLDPNATNSHDELSPTTKGKYTTTTNNSNPTIVKLKQPLIKQVSLSNPPMCYRNLNDDEAYSENSIYESNSQTKSFTSNQELKKMLSSSSAYSNAGEAAPNGQTASSYLPASRSGKLEKIGDPTLMLKNRHQTTSTGRQTTTNDYDAINRSSKSSNALLRTDSLSSEATSDKSKQLDQYEYNEDEEEENELEPAAKTTTVSTAPPPRKQPSIPAALSNTDPNVIKNKLLIKYASNKQQSSLTSSDDETNISEEIRNAKNQDDQDEEVDDDEEEEEEEDEEDEEQIDQDEDEEEEDNDLEEDELDEEVRSITECTTNDETELESTASTSVRRRKSNQHESSSLHSASKLNNLSSTQINTNDSNSRRKPPLIDNYLVQNLEKEEILAAKINKFLSVSGRFWL